MSRRDQEFKEELEKAIIAVTNMHDIAITNADDSFKNIFRSNKHDLLMTLAYLHGLHLLIGTLSQITAE